jgi:pilus assembly protein Flp/PilA
LLYYEGDEMKSLRVKALRAFKKLIREEGQDLVEYALLVALIAFAATSGMKTLATRINSTFVSIGTTLTSDVA